MGRMPNIVAKLVIKIGRKRDTADSRMASSNDNPASFLWLANSTIRIPFFETNPTSMMIPIWLKMFIVCPKYHNDTNAPIKASGTVSMIISGSRKLSNWADNTR